MADVSKIAANGIEYDVEDAVARPDIASLQANITAIEDEISSIESDISSVQSDVSALQSGVSSIQSNISSIEGDISSLESAVAARQTKLQYIEETIAVSFEAGVIGTRGFQQQLVTSVPSGKKLIGAVITYIERSAEIIPVLFSSSNNLYLNAYRATTSAVANNSVTVRFTIA